MYKNDTLRYSSSDKNEWPLLPIGKHTFILIHPAVNPIIKFDSKKHQMITKIENNLPRAFTFLQKNLDKKTNNLNMLVGNYYSQELKTMYSISIDDKSNIYLEHARNEIIKL